MYVWRIAFPEIAVSEGLSYNEAVWSTMAVAREGIKKRDNIMKLYVFSEDAFEHIMSQYPHYFELCWLRHVKITKNHVYFNRHENWRCVYRMCLSEYVMWKSNIVSSRQERKLT